MQICELSASEKRKPTLIKHGLGITGTLGLNISHSWKDVFSISERTDLYFFSPLMFIALNKKQYQV